MVLGWFWAGLGFRVSLGLVGVWFGVGLVDLGLVLGWFEVCLGLV